MLWLGTLSVDANIVAMFCRRQCHHWDRSRHLVGSVRRKPIWFFGRSRLLCWLRCRLSRWRSCYSQRCCCCVPPLVLVFRRWSGSTCIFDEVERAESTMHFSHWCTCTCIYMVVLYYSWYCTQYQYYSTTFRGRYSVHCTHHQRRFYCPYNIIKNYSGVLVLVQILKVYYAWKPLYVPI
jgi:hypothetical protein